MFRRLRAWWEREKHPYGSPGYNAASEILEPGYQAQLAQQKARAADRHQQEAAWFASLVELQNAGRVDEAAARAEADMKEGRASFVLEPMESIAMLYAREVDRLLALGDPAGAKRARDEASRHMSIWASWSTSGGEGTARSNAGARMEQELDAKLQQYNARTR